LPNAWARINKKAAITYLLEWERLNALIYIIKLAIFHSDRFCFFPKAASAPLEFHSASSKTRSNAHRGLVNLHHLKCRERDEVLIGDHEMKTLKNCLSVSVLLAVVVLSSGCETMSSAYDSTKETVSGWFGKGEKKAD
jgi:hypothetical protein